MSIQPAPLPGMTSTGRLFRDRRARPRPEPGTLQVGEADLSLPVTLRRHWREYAVEALFLAVYVLAAGLVSAWLEAGSGFDLAGAAHPATRRLFAGVAAGAVVVCLVYSPWGRRSGSHMNPAITLAYLRLGRIGRWDALAYVTAQLVGGGAAVLVMRSVMPMFLPATVLSGSIGPATGWATFLTEFVLSAAAMLMILYTGNHARWFRWTGLLYGLVITAVVASAAPLASFGMNPARLLAVDLSASLPGAGWLNLLPPFLGALVAVDLYRVLTGRQEVLCAKLAHNTHGRCIFRCQHPYQTRAQALETIRQRTGSSGLRP